MRSTKIEWADSTINPVIGCTFGCDFCYARRMNNRFGWIEDFSKPQFFPERLKQLYCKKPKNIFMDSMSDIADWEPEWIAEVFKAIARNGQHNYLFLTKRPGQIYERWIQFCYKNIWCGATGTGHQTVNEAIYYLDDIRGCNTFLSIEPLLNEVQFAKGIEHINWVIIGSETGNRKGKVKPKPEWVQSIIDQCRAAGVPVFLKDNLHWPEVIREFPEGM